MQTTYKERRSGQQWSQRPSGWWESTTHGLLSDEFPRRRTLHNSPRVTGSTLLNRGTADQLHGWSVPFKKQFPSAGDASTSSRRVGRVENGQLGSEKLNRRAWQRYGLMGSREFCQSFLSLDGSSPSTLICWESFFLSDSYRWNIYARWSLFAWTSPLWWHYLPTHLPPLHLTLNDFSAVSQH